MYPHRIRLRGPWEYEPLARRVIHDSGQMEMRTESLPPPGRMILPCPWRDGGLSDFAGKVRFRRRFGWPGRIDASESVWLTFAGAGSGSDVWLNGKFLGRHEGTSTAFDFPITSLLQLRNELIVEVDVSPEASGLWGEVALEVRPKPPSSVEVIRSP